MSPEPNLSTPKSAAREVVLFHSVLGVRPAVEVWAERLREAGHTVHVPDLYEGEVFDDFDTGMRHVESIGGIPTLIERSQRAVADLPAGLVYAGFSNGAASAELLAATRPGARGAILMHGALPIEAFGADRWPATVPVQVHCMARDPFRDQGAIDAFVASARRAGAPCELFDYPGTGHLFADPELPDFDPVAAEAMAERVLRFLAALGETSVTPLERIPARRG